MSPRTLPLSLALSIAFVVAPVGAASVQVEFTGEVEFNQIGSGPFADVIAGDRATVSFRVDSDVFTDSPSFPTRGYDIDQDSFSFEVGPVTTALQDPFPVDETPYFVIRDNDPAVDGFWTSTNIDFPLGVPTEIAGAFGQFTVNFQVTYGGERLPSLDILDAIGTYDFDGLQVFNFTVDDGPFMPMGLIFEQLTIRLAGPTLAVTGDCPGSIDVSVTGATANEMIALATGSGPGSEPVPSGVCMGTELGLADPVLIGTASTDEVGAFSASRVIGMNQCSRSLQIVDLATCAVSGVALTP